MEDADKSHHINKTKLGSGVPPRSKHSLEHHLTFHPPWQISFHWVRRLHLHLVENLSQWPYSLCPSEALQISNPGFCLVLFIQNPISLFSQMTPIYTFTSLPLSHPLPFRSANLKKKTGPIQLSQNKQWANWGSFTSSPLAMVFSTNFPITLNR